MTRNRGGAMTSGSTAAGSAAGSWAAESSTTGSSAASEIVAGAAAGGLSRARAARSQSAPLRTVVCGDGVTWLRDATPLAPGVAIVTSLPDTSELPELGFEGWRGWFVDTVELACRAVADEAVAVFYQTDVKRDGRWIDKGFLVQLGIERAGSALLWHRIVCRVPPGTTTFGRPAYAHLLCASRGLRLAPGQASPDVLPTLGHMTWARAMGVEACLAVAQFLLEHTRCTAVADPFCGVGTMLAVANHAGLDAFGVERSRKRAERARTLLVREP